MMTRKLVVDWRPILLESFFVVLGVVVALAANEVRQAVVQRREAATALASIREELATNRRAVLESASYHIRLNDTLFTYVRSAPGGASAPARVPDVRVFERGFINPAQLLSTAWNAASATEAVHHMQYADVLLLARIYEEQRDYQRQSEQVGSIIYGGIFNQGMGGVLRNYSNLSSIISSFWYRECQLLRSYDEVLPRLRAEGAATGDPPPPAPERCRRIPRR
ncbi:MAG TPA: hypothetical protein VFX98_18710 [Longimicrobiaceae bacterium]|nr:hypothetical protein [Longimicrobiaceae bacterium]